jgi:hypothetical protein
MFDYIKVWHQNKITTNPTILNCSFGWAYTIPYADITAVTYRGTTFSGPFTIPDLNSYGIYVNSDSNARIPYRIAAMEADVTDCINAGKNLVTRRARTAGNKTLR